MRITSVRRACVLFVLGMLSACSGADATSPTGAVDETSAESPESPLETLGGFEGSFDPETGEISIRALDAALDGAGSLHAKADTVTGVSASSSGVPSGGGVVAFSPSGATTVGCPGGGTRCGPVRLVNRTAANTLLRNAYAVVTELSSGWSLANADTKRAFGVSGAPASPVGYFYYEHLLASDRPTAATTPADGKVGFRGDRTWSFKKTSPSASDAFTFRFHVYARSVVCVPTVTEEIAGDTTYAPTVDRDCDGVPGVSRNRALFVDPVNGNDATADGTILRPFATPTAAAAQASETRDTLVIGAGTYGSTAKWLDLSTAPIRNVIGAFDASNGFADRRLNGSAPDRASTTLTFATGTTGAPDGFALYRAGATAPLYVEGLTLRATGGPSGSAYAIFSSGSSAASLTLRDVALFATGGAGPAAPAGATGARGSDGLTRSPVDVPGPSCSATGGEGSGGHGGHGGSNSRRDGGPGGAGTPGGGSVGPRGLSDSDWTYAGSSGGPGGNGGHGTAPSATIATAWFSSAGFVASQSGGKGAAGKNGGGGGGGGYDRGGSNDGSSGGAGGCGGAGGPGGPAGGGAFGVFGYATSGTVSVRFLGNVAVNARAGSGGQGGVGGAGGGGGVGGSNTAPRDGTNAGGKGGNGGNGGNGSGGNGGPAICAVIRGTTPTVGSTFSCTRNGGVRGAPAPTGGNFGVAGQALDTFKLP